MIPPRDQFGPWVPGLDGAERQARPLRRLLIPVAVMLATAPASQAVRIVRRRLKSGHARLVRGTIHAVCVNHLVGSLTRRQRHVLLLQHDGLDCGASERRRERAFLRHGWPKTAHKNDGNGDGSEASHDNLPKHRAQTLSCAVVANVSSALSRGEPDGALRRSVGCSRPSGARERSAAPYRSAAREARS